MLCLRQRRLEETIQHAEAALQLAPRGPMAYLLVANVALGNFRLGRYEEALLSSERSLLLNPAFTYALKDRAVILEKMGRRVEALDTLRKLRAAESSVTLEDLQAGNLAIFYAPEDAAEMNAVLERLWPDAEPDAPTV
jgi:tetratricopeptide (TPR) repeat protein